MSGKIFVDLNNDCTFGFDYPIPYNRLVDLNSGKTHFTDVNGDFNIAFNSGINTLVNIQSINSPYQAAACSNDTIVFDTDSTLSLTQNLIKLPFNDIEIQVHKSGVFPIQGDTGIFIITVKRINITSV